MNGKGLKHTKRTPSAARPKPQQKAQGTGDAIGGLVMSLLGAVATKP